jgi:hypothetical protein
MLNPFALGMLLLSSDVLASMSIALASATIRLHTVTLDLSLSTSGTSNVFIFDGRKHSKSVHVSIERASSGTRRIYVIFCTSSYFGLEHRLVPELRFAVSFFRTRA